MSHQQSSTDDQLLSTIGQRMPYRTPVGFFDAHKQSLKTLVAARDTRPRRAVRWWYAAACAGIIAIYPVGRMIYRAIYEPVPVYGATNDADEWSEFANADIFLEIK